MSTTPLELNDYRCDVCEFVYRPAHFGNVDLSDQPDDFACPNCQATKSHFQVDTEPEDAIEDGADAGDDSEEETVAAGEGAVATADGAGLTPRRIYTNESDPSVATLKELRDEG